MGPSCFLLGLNLIVFIMVSRVIFTPRLTAKASTKEKPKITAAQVRGAFTVMVLLGVTWVFGTMAIGKVKIIFHYLFCISNSLQGFLIFFVRCLLHPEARNAWMLLIRTGRRKKHRGVFPPGAVSFSTNSGAKQGQSPNTTSRTENTNDSACGSYDRNGFNR